MDPDFVLPNLDHFPIKLEHRLNEPSTIFLIKLKHFLVKSEKVFLVNNILILVKP